MGEPKLFCAAGCNLSEIQVFSPAIIGQVNVAGGSNLILLSPTLLSSRGAGAPHIPSCAGGSASETMVALARSRSHSCFAAVISASVQGGATCLSGGTGFSGAW